MAAPPKIPPKLFEDLLRLRADGKSGQDMADWLKTEHGVKVSRQAVQNKLAAIDKEREPIARAVAIAKLTKSVATDLDAVEAIIDRAIEDEKFAGKTDDTDEELECIAHSDFLKVMDKNGAMLPADKIPEKTRRAISSIKIEQIEVPVPGVPGGNGEDGEDGEVRAAGRIIEVKFWDKNKGIVELNRSREKLVSRELRIKARDQQLRARALRLEIAGANGKPEDLTAVRARLDAKLAAAEAVAATK